MQRRLPAQKVERLLWKKAKKEADSIAQALQAFARDSCDAVAEAYEELMATDLPWLSDRDAELWLPLYAVCSVAMSSRLTELQHASKLLCDTKAETDEDESVALKLLKDLMEVWPNDQSRVETKVLISQLKQVDASPWSEEDFHLSGRKLARILRPFGVTPIKYEHGKRGYERAALGPAWNRYLATHAPHPPPH